MMPALVMTQKAVAQSIVDGDFTNVPQFVGARANVSNAVAAISPSSATKRDFTNATNAYVTSGQVPTLGIKKMVETPGLEDEARALAQGDIGAGLNLIRVGTSDRVKGELGNSDVFDVVYNDRRGIYEVRVDEQALDRKIGSRAVSGRQGGLTDRAQMKQDLLRTAKPTWDAHASQLTLVANTLGRTGAYADPQVRGASEVSIRTYYITGGGLRDVTGTKPMMTADDAFDAAVAETVKKAREQNFSSAAVAGSYDAKVAAKEGGNSPTAKNPDSTATGLHQFIRGTWLGLVKDVPALAAAAKGKTEAEILALRTNPELSNEAFAVFTAQNEARLRTAGLPVTEATKYLAHFSGPGVAVQLLKADPDEPVSKYYKPDAIIANPTVLGGNKTVGDVIQWAERQMRG
jgi:hypothetical protein